MADGESSGLQAAHRDLMGALAEAQAFGLLLERSSLGDGVWDVLLGGALGRLCGAVERFDHSIHSAGINVYGVDRVGG